jgi:hypothetical protein
MATQRKNEPGGRTHTTTIRLSEAEKKALQVRANSMSVTVSRLLVDSALMPDDATQAQQWKIELRALRRQVSESGYTPDLEAQISDLLRRIAE